MEAVSGLAGPLQGVLEVGGGDKPVGVLEDDVLTEVEGVDLAVGADLPARGDVGDDLEVFVDGDEAAEDLDDVGGRGGVAGQGGIEGHGVAARQH